MDVFPFTSHSGRLSPEIQRSYFVANFSMITSMILLSLSPCPRLSLLVTSKTGNLQKWTHVVTHSPSPQSCSPYLPFSSFLSLLDACNQDSSCAVFGLGAVGLAVIYGCKMAGLSPPLAILLHICTRCLCTRQSGHCSAGLRRKSIT